MLDPEPPTFDDDDLSILPEPWELSELPDDLGLDYAEADEPPEEEEIEWLKD